jgi:hypothetical protein
MRLSFRLKLTLLACVVAIVPLVTVGWIVNDINREALQDTNRQLLDSVIASLSSTLEDRDLGGVIARCWPRPAPSTARARSAMPSSRPRSTPRA